MLRAASGVVPENRPSEGELRGLDIN